MLSRCCALVAGAFLVAVVLSAPPAAAGPAGTSCALLPWEGTADAAVSPLAQDQTSFILKTSCSTSAQCPVGQACNCGQCHPACGTGERWSCICQVCYQRCPSGYFFDDSLCACAPV